jgi:hypothetical protein
MTYKRKGYSLTNYPKTGATMLIFELSEFLLKLYDKGLQFHQQFNTPNNLFRYELKVIRGRFLNEMNIHTLDDLMNRKTWMRLSLKLKEVFSQLVIFSFNESKQNLKPKQKEIISYLSNRDYWKELNQKQFERNKLHVQKYSSLNALKLEVESLLNIELNHIINDKQKRGCFPNISETRKGVVFLPSLKGENTPQTHYCKIRLNRQKGV